MMEIFPIKQMVHMVSESFRRVSSADAIFQLVYKFLLEKLRTLIPA